MRALTYHGPYTISVDNMPDPILQAPDVIIIRVTATAICGSDLHLYRGKIPGTHHGDIFGHEFMGEVVEAGVGGDGRGKGRPGGRPRCDCLRGLFFL